MQRFTDAIAKAVREKNWYAAVTLSLTMPDVCGRMEHPKHGSERRYKAWWDKYMLVHYHTVLSGGDAYALRCAYLHEGSGDVLNQRARQALTHFYFVAPPMEGRRISQGGDVGFGGGKISFHCKQRILQGNSILILQIDIFCREMIDAVGRWSNEVRDNQAVQERLQSLLEIHETSLSLLGSLYS